MLSVGSLTLLDQFVDSSGVGGLEGVQLLNVLVFLCDVRFVLSLQGGVVVVQGLGGLSFKSLDQSLEVGVLLNESVLVALAIGGVVFESLSVLSDVLLELLAGQLVLVRHGLVRVEVLLQVVEDS